MSQALYRKWRPQSWEAVVGQEHIVQTLKNALAAERVAHAYLFAGPRGTGKTTTARLLAKAVNCLEADIAGRPCGKCDHCQAVNAGRFLDLIEIDAASNTSVEDVRDLREKIGFSPNQGRFKVYIIDEVHMLSTAAFNALLKTLEEPPPHAIFILATTEVHKIPATVLSRCQRHEFRRIPVADIVNHLQAMADGENIEVDPEALVLVARQSTGAMRDAISLLDQLASTGQRITLDLAQNVLGTAANQSVLNILDALTERRADAGLDHIHHALDAGSDPRQFARQIVDYLRDLLLIRMGNADQIDATAETRAAMARHAQHFEVSELLRIIRVFNHAATEARSTWQPALPLEMALVESLTPPAAVSAAPAVQPATAAAPAPAAAAPAPPRAVAERPAAQPAAEDGASIPEGEAATANDQLFRKVNETWRQVLQLVRQESPFTQGLLNSCRLIGVKDGVLFLGFNSEINRKKMEDGDHIAITQKVLAQFMGSDIPIRCLVASGKRASLPPDVDSDGMVAAALRDLGGEIVDVS